jgi:protein-tyrosine phosphatase
MSAFPPLLPALPPASPPSLISSSFVSIFPWLFLGDFSAASDDSLLEKLQITHILNVTEELPNLFPSKFIYHRYPISDTISTPILSVLYSSCALLTELDPALSNNTHRVFVHCSQGISRSVAVICAYYLKCHYPITLSSTLSFVRSVRPPANPNIGFIYQLNLFLIALENSTQPSKFPSTKEDFDYLSLHQSISEEEIEKILGVKFDNSKQQKTSGKFPAIMVGKTKISEKEEKTTEFSQLIDWMDEFMSGEMSEAYWHQYGVNEVQDKVNQIDNWNSFLLQSDSILANKTWVKRLEQNQNIKLEGRMQELVQAIQTARNH